VKEIETNSVTLIVQDLSLFKNITLLLCIVKLMEMAYISVSTIHFRLLLYV